MPLQKPLKPSPPPAPRKSSLTSRGAVSASPGAPTASTARSQLSKPSTSTSGKQSTPSSPISRGPSSPRTGLKRDDSLGVGFTDALLTRQERQQLASQQQHQSSSSQAFSAASSPRGGAAAGGGVAPAPKRGGFRRGGGKHGSGKHSSHHDDVLQRLAELHQQPWFRLRVAIRCILFALRAGRGVTRYRRHLYETTVLYPKAAFVIQCAWRRRCAHRRIVCRLAAARIRDFVKPKIQLRLQHKYQLIHLVQPIARGYLGRKQLQAAHHANRHLFATTAILKRIQIKVAAKLLRNIRMRREEVDILLEETAMASHAVIRQEFAAFTALQQQFTSQYRSLLVRARDAFLASHAADPHVASINLPNVHSTPAPSTLLPPLPSSSAHPSGVPPPAEQQPLPPLHVPTTFGFRKELDRLQASGKFMVDVPVTTTAPLQSHAHHHPHPHHHQNRSLPPTAPPSSSHHHHPAFPHTSSGGYGYFQNAQLTHSSSVRTDPALPTPTGSTAALRGGGPSHHDSIAGATVTRPLVPFLQRGSLAMAITLTTQIEEFDHPAAAGGDDVNNSVLGGGTESPLGTVISLDSRRSSDQPPRDLGATATTKSTPPLDGPPMPMSAPSSPPPPASLPATNSNSAMETLQRDSNSSSALTQHSNTTTTMHSLVRTLFATKSLLAAARYNLSEAARLRLNSTLAPNNTSASSFGFQDEDKSTSDLQEGKKGATTTTTTSVPQAKRTNSNLLDDHNHHGDAAGRVATSTDLLGQSGAAIMVSIDFDDEAAAQSVLANYNNKDVTSSSSPLPTSLVPVGGAATRTSSQSPPMVLSRSTSSGSSKHHPSPQRVESPAAVALIPSQGHVSPLLAAITMGSGQPSVMIPNPIVRHSSASQEQMPPMLPPAAVISMSVAASPMLAPQGAASPPESLSPTGSTVSRPHSFHRNTSWSTTGASGREGGGGGAGGGHASPAASPSAYGHHVTSGGNLLSPYGSAQSPAGLLGVRRHSRRKSSRALLPPDDVQLAFMALLQRTESIERKALQNEIREAIHSMHQHAKWFMVVVQHRDAVPRAFSSLLPQLSPLWLLELAVRLFYDEAHERAAITAEYEAMPLMYLTRPMLGTSTEERRQKMKEQLRQRGAKLNAQAYSQQQLQLTMMLQQQYQQQQQGGGGATGTGVQQSSPPALRNLGIPGAGDSLSVSPAQGYLPTTPQLLGFDSRGATPSFLFVPSESGGGHGGTGGGGSHLVSDDYSENETSSIALASTSRPFVSPAPSIGLPPSASALLPRSGAGGVVSPAPPPLHAGASLDANTTNASGGGVVDSLFFPMLGSSNVRAGAAAVLSASRPGGATNTTNNARRRLSSFEANALFPSRAQGSTGPTGLSVTNTAPPPLLPPTSSTGVPRVAPQTRTATEMLRLDMLHASQNRVRTMLMMKEFEHRGGAAGGAVEAKVPPKPKAVSIAAAFIRGLSVPKTESGGGGADYQSVGRPQW